MTVNIIYVILYRDEGWLGLTKGIHMKTALLLFGNTKRERLARSDKWSNAYRVAMMFFSELVLMGTGVKRVNRACGDHENHTQYLCSRCPEGSSTRDSLLRADRLEARFVVALPRAGGRNKSFFLEVRAYELRKKRPCYQSSFLFMK